MHLTCGRALATIAVLISALFLRGQSTPPAVQPYTAEFEVTTTQPLGDVIRTDMWRRVSVRDSQDRTRTEWTHLYPSDQPAITTVIVFDPVEQTRISWSLANRVADVVKLLSPLEQRSGCWSRETGDYYPIITQTNPPNPALPPPLNLKEQDLGTQMIMGVEAHGRRKTQQIPAGQEGNDQPLVKIAEGWSAPSLGFNLRQIFDNEHGLRRTEEVVSLDLNEPNPSQFQLPADKDPLPEMYQHPCATR